MPAPGDLTVNMLSAHICLVGEDLDTGYDLRSPECPLLIDEGGRGPKFSPLKKMRPGVTGEVFGLVLFLFVQI